MYKRQHQSFDTRAKADARTYRCRAGATRGDLNKQLTRISEIQKSVTLKIVEAEISVSSVEEAMSNEISDVEDYVALVKDSVSTIKESIANIKEQIKSEVK